MSRLLAAGLLFCAGVTSAWAGGWDVNPIRLDLDAQVRTGALTVHNDGDVSLRFQVSLAAWTQDASGNDHYADSRALVYFPQIMSLEPGERRVIRVGNKQQAAQAEQSYRLFVEEIAAPEEAQDGGGTAVAVRVRFGVPIFVAAAAPQAAAEITGIERAEDAVQVRVHNGGNGHFKIDRIVLSGRGKDLAEAPGWYVLPGATRAFTLPVDGSVCATGGPFELRLEGEELSLRHPIDAVAAVCGH